MCCAAPRLLSYPVQLYLESKFVFAPAGVGYDCYRYWEALLFGAVLVVEKSPGFEKVPLTTSKASRSRIPGGGTDDRCTPAIGLLSPTPPTVLLSS